MCGSFKLLFILVHICTCKYKVVNLKQAFWRSYKGEKCCKNYVPLLFLSLFLRIIDQLSYIIVTSLAVMQHRSVYGPGCLHTVSCKHCRTLHTFQRIYAEVKNILDTWNKRLVALWQSYTDPYRVSSKDIACTLLGLYAAKAVFYFKIFLVYCKCF
jgi:hypothetical protein